MTTMVTVGNSLPSEEAHFENLVDQCKGVLIERQFAARFEYMASRSYIDAFSFMQSFPRWIGTVPCRNCQRAKICLGTK